MGRNQAGARGGQLLLNLCKHVSFLYIYIKSLFCNQTPEVRFIRPYSTSIITLLGIVSNNMLLVSLVYILYKAVIMVL